MMSAAVVIGSLGLPRGEFSGSAAVAWNSAYVVAAGGGRAPCGPGEKEDIKNPRPLKYLSKRYMLIQEDNDEFRNPNL